MSTKFESAYVDVRRAVRNPVRLAAVRMTELLHSQSEVFFDRLTRMAATVAKAPAAFLSLVNEHSDFYKSCYGFDEALTCSRELTGVTFCHFALVSDGPLVIEDTRGHPVFRTVPTVESMNIAAYLGVPLSVGGQALGAFCVIDHRPRRWSDSEIDGVAALARSANSEIVARVRARQEEHRERLAVENPTGRDSARALEERLSKREMEVLSRILAGRGTKEIAVELGMGDKTVATHRSRLLRKLNLQSSRDLFAYAIRHRLVDWA